MYSSSKILIKLLFFYFSHFDYFHHWATEGRPEGRPGVLWTATFGENTLKIHLIF